MYFIKEVNRTGNALLVKSNSRLSRSQAYLYPQQSPYLNGAPPCTVGASVKPAEVGLNSPVGRDCFSPIHTGGTEAERLSHLPKGGM